MTPMDIDSNPERPCDPVYALDSGGVLPASFWTEIIDTGKCNDTSASEPDTGQDLPDDLLSLFHSAIPVSTAHTSDTSGSTLSLAPAAGLPGSCTEPELLFPVGEAFDESTLSASDEEMAAAVAECIDALMADGKLCYDSCILMIEALTNITSDDSLSSKDKLSELEAWVDMGLYGPRLRVCDFCIGRCQPN